MDGTPPRYQSRLEPLHDIVETLGPAWDADNDPGSGRSARALEVTHKRLHERLKPDETAEGRAFALARKKTPPPTMNAQSIVIHPLHRPGAPGVDRPVAAVAPAAAATTTTVAASTTKTAPENRE